MCVRASKAPLAIVNGYAGTSEHSLLAIQLVLKPYKLPFLIFHTLASCLKKPYSDDREPWHVISKNVTFDKCRLRTACAAFFEA